MGNLLAFQIRETRSYRIQWQKLARNCDVTLQLCISVISGYVNFMLSNLTKMYTLLGIAFCCCFAFGK